MSSVPQSSPTASQRASAPSRYELIPAFAVRFAGGPVGRYAAIGRRGWRPAAALLSALSSVILALSVLQRNSCVSNGWATPGSLWRYCYSDLPTAVAAPGGNHPWASSTIGGMPPLSAILTWFVQVLVPDGSQLRLQQGMFAFGAAVIALLIATAVCLTAAALPQGPWAAAHIALSPVLFTVGLTSFDALGVLMISLALFAWYRSRYAWAGAAAMGALLTRPLLAVVLVAFVLIATSRSSQVSRSVLTGAGVTALAILTPMFMLSPDPWLGLRTWHYQGASYGSLWHVIDVLGSGPSSDVLTALAVLGWVIAVLFGLALVRFERLNDPAPVALVLLTVVLFFARAVPAQTALWFLPLLAACAVLWRNHLIWAATEVAYFIVLWPTVARDSNPAKALPWGWYVFGVLVRFAGMIFIATQVLRWRASLQTDYDDERGSKRPRSAAQGVSLRSEDAV